MFASCFAGANIIHDVILIALTVGCFQFVFIVSILWSHPKFRRLRNGALVSARLLGTALTAPMRRITSLFCRQHQCLMAGWCSVWVWISLLNVGSIHPTDVSLAPYDLFILVLSVLTFAVYLCNLTSLTSLTHRNVRMCPSPAARSRLIQLCAAQRIHRQLVDSLYHTCHTLTGGLKYLTVQHPIWEVDPGVYIVCRQS